VATPWVEAAWGVGAWGWVEVGRAGWAAAGTVAGAEMATGTVDLHSQSP
jgi:hypothetical protein